jgi:hypothetical protein
MIINNLNIVRIALAPNETNAPLAVDANAVLAFSAAFQRFQPVSRRHNQFAQFRGGMKRKQFPPRGPLNRWRQPAGQFRPKNPLCLRTGKAGDHVQQ